MAEVRMYLGGERAGALFERSTRRNTARVLSSIRSAASQAAENIQTRGRLDISNAGKFGTRWTEGLTAKVTEGGGHIRVSVTEKVPYWTVFEFGATIQGKPLLWIPLSFADDAQGIRARDYPGMLFRVDRVLGGAPLLLSADDKQPKYFGKESVTIPKKFHLRQIIREEARSLKGYYASAMKLAARLPVE